MSMTSQNSKNDSYWRCSLSKQWIFDNSKLIYEAEDNEGAFKEINHKCNVCLW
jgi:hypothetical protein